MMNKLSLPKKALAVAGAILLFATVSGTALAMIDPGLRSLSPRPVTEPAAEPAVAAPAASPAQIVPAGPASSRSSSSKAEFTGTLEVMAATGWVIGGRTVQVTSATQIGAGVQIGRQVKVHVQVQADGSLLAREIKLIVPAGSNDNGNMNGNGNENENGNSNENENENGNGNVNDNENENDDDHGNGNHNENDDDHGGNHNSDD